MSAEESSEHLRRLIDSVKADWQGSYRKLPDPAIFALQDATVLAAIKSRFAKGVRITGIRCSRTSSCRRYRPTVSNRLCWIDLRPATPLPSQPGRWPPPKCVAASSWPDWGW